MSRIKLIDLSQGKQAIVDNEDYERIVSHGNWCVIDAKGVDYAVNTRTRILMHNFILGEYGIDHINRNGLDNRRENLRLATPHENQGNRRGWGSTSKYKGVSWDADRKKWRANLSMNGKTKLLGRFAAEEEAARAYDSAAKEYFGEFALLNF